ncbi:Aldehyde/histidinol dehydrogenase [Cyathus striatus]|nr:Aldehyde/histidinol dehydrogenase [Cyathus striatus]
MYRGPVTVRLVHRLWGSRLDYLFSSPLLLPVEPKRKASMQSTTHDHSQDWTPLDELPKARSLPPPSPLPHQKEQIHATLQETFKSHLTLPIAFRQQQFLALSRMAQENAESFAAAIFKDIGRPAQETYMAEIAPIVQRSIICARKVGEWAKEERKVLAEPWMGSWECSVRREAKGVVFVISPWNYPMMLSLQPLYGAISAGCCALIKLSEFAPHYAALLAELMPKYLDSRAYRVVRGGVDEVTRLLEMKFDHIFYTGNPRIARLIAAAAAKHLTPLTLELGGKSPVFIDEKIGESELDVAARRILWGKSNNCGQICVTPDYTLLPRHLFPTFLASLKKAIAEFYPQGSLHSDSFSRIISEVHFERLVGLLRDTKGEILIGGGNDAHVPPEQRRGGKESRRRVLNLVFEIFGPILPILLVDNLDEAIEYTSPIGYIRVTQDEDVKRKVVLLMSFRLVELVNPDVVPSSGCLAACTKRVIDGRNVLKYSFDLLTYERAVTDIPINNGHEKHHHHGVLGKILHVVHPHHAEEGGKNGHAHTHHHEGLGGNSVQNGGAMGGVVLVLGVEISSCRCRMGNVRYCGVYPLRVFVISGACYIYMAYMYRRGRAANVNEIGENSLTDSGGMLTCPSFLSSIRPPKEQKYAEYDARPESRLDTIGGIHATLQETFKSHLTLPIAFRQQQLLALARMAQENAESFAAALFKDIGRPVQETYMAEVGPVVQRAIICARNVGEWAKEERKVLGEAWMGEWECKVRREAKGVVFVISPWNYPMILSLQPLYGAICAGCCALIKLSEFVPHYAALLAELMPKYLDQRAYRVVRGGVNEVTRLLEMKFDHIFYTGNPRIARLIAAAAAKHLTPLTLELGGKSPVFIDENIGESELDIAARRVLWGKSNNCGQGSLHSDSFARIISDAQFERRNINWRRERCAFPTEQRRGGKGEPKKVLSLVFEIFGPILPILLVDNLDEAIDMKLMVWVMGRPHPLVIYAFTQDEGVKRKILENTNSGNIAFGDTFEQMAVNELPFGGVGESGYGRHVLKYSFDLFTYERAVTDIPIKNEHLNAMRYPPYTAQSLEFMKVPALEHVPSFDELQKELHAASHNGVLGKILHAVHPHHDDAKLPSYVIGLVVSRVGVEKLLVIKGL